MIVQMALVNTALYAMMLLPIIRVLVRKDLLAQTVTLTSMNVLTILVSVVLVLILSMASCVIVPKVTLVHGVISIQMTALQLPASTVDLAKTVLQATNAHANPATLVRDARLM